MSSPKATLVAPEAAPAASGEIKIPEVTPASGPTIEAEADDYDDNDSAIDSSTASSTTSIGSSILNYRMENGRRYHAYKDGKYIFPNDEEETDRLDLQHHLFTLTFGGKLYTAPIPKEQQLHNVLDVGTGTGIWAIDFADEHPETQVLGVDLSPIQPSFLPPNSRFEIDDIEEVWTFNRKFDLIYSRMMTGSLSSWPRYFEQAFENLNPGGWIEAADICVPHRSDDNTLDSKSALYKWGAYCNEAALKLGRSINSANLYKQQMEAAGFQNVVEVVYKWPTNRWPKDRTMKEMGLWCNENIAASLYGLSVGLFTRGLGWTLAELEVYLVEVRKQMSDTKIHAWVPIYVVYGQKPKSS